MTTNRNRIVVSGIVLATLLAAARPARAEAPAKSPYAPYEFLIGSWDFGPESGGPAQGRILFRWGPSKSYIWFATSLLAGDKEEPHFEGLLMWNGERKDLDMGASARSPSHSF